MKNALKATQFNEIKFYSLPCILSIFTEKIKVVKYFVVPFLTVKNRLSEIVNLLFKLYSPFNT